jgi:ABC-type polysaccharide transport system, permease component
MATSTAARQNWKRYLPLSLMVLPGVIYFIINSYLPMFGLVIAFKDVNYAKGILGSDWVGFKNFTYLFATQDAWVITRNTIFYNLAFIVINLVVAVALALFLNEVRSAGFKKFYQSSILLPMLISMVIVSYLVYAALSVETGFLNKSLLPLFGIKPISWYNEPAYWPIILSIVQLWKGAGFLCVVYYAAIIGIDGELYEAATIDGASKGQQIRKITLPLLVPVMVMMTLMAVGRIFYSDFGLFYQIPMNSGMLSDATSTIDTYVYRGLMQLGDIGMSSAAGFYQSIVGFIVVMLANLLVRRINPENALF